MKAIAVTRRACSSVATVGVAALLSCSSPTHSAQGVARAFVDRLFVEVDQRAALELTDSLARAKIEKELKLLAGHRPSDPDERPRVFYRQLREVVHGDGMTLHFRLTVVIIGEQPIEPELIVRVHPVGDEWRVSNFEILPSTVDTPPV